MGSQDQDQDQNQEREYPKIDIDRHIHIHSIYFLIYLQGGGPGYRGEWFFLQFRCLNIFFLFSLLLLWDNIKIHHILQASAPLLLDWRMGESDMVS